LYKKCQLFRLGAIKFRTNHITLTFNKYQTTAVVVFKKGTKNSNPVKGFAVVEKVCSF
jgi:hypothetical protein